MLKEAQSLGAPQALVAKAKDLGLVSPGAPGLISLSESKVTQDAEVAVKAKDSKQEYGTLPLPGSTTSESKKTESKAKEEKSSTPKTTVGKTSQEANDSTASAQDSKETVVTTAKSNREVADNGRPVFQESELNGGTIPAPSTKSPAG